MTALDNATGTEPAVLAQVLRGDPEPGSVTDHVALERVGSVAVVTLARPEQYNALSLASWRRLGEHLHGPRRPSATSGRSSYAGPVTGRSARELTSRSSRRCACRRRTPWSTTSRSRRP